MQLLEEFCLSEYYHFNESLAVVNLEDCSYIDHTINFRSFRNTYNWMESLVSKIADSVIESKREMNKRSITSISMDEQERIEQGENMMDRVACGLPVDFGTKHSILKQLPPRKKQKKKQVIKEKCVMEDILSEMVLQIYFQNQWIPCSVIDMDPPVEEDLVTIHRFVVQPFTCLSVEEETLILQPDEVKFVSSEQLAVILQSSFHYPNHRTYLSIQIYESSDLSLTKERLPSSLRKYYNQRYTLFSRWDKGIQFDEEGLYSVTPEALALHTAIRCSCGVVVDAFAGLGGNTIQLARTCRRVIAIDMNLARLKLLHTNSCIYNVQKRIELVCGDAVKLLPTLKADVVVLAPPWGGVEYAQRDVFRLEDLPPGLDGTMLFHLARTVTRNIVYILPRNIDRRQVALLAEPGEVVELVDGCIEGSVKMVIAYFGELAYPSSPVKSLLYTCLNKQHKIHHNLHIAANTHG